MSPPTASVIAATLNEEANIDHVLDTALRNAAVLEVIIADGGSQDSTIQRVLERAKSDPRVSLLHNPDRGEIEVGDREQRLHVEFRTVVDPVEAAGHEVASSVLV